MDKETYSLIKRAHKNNVDEHKLKKIKIDIPVIENRVKLLLGEVNKSTDPFAKVRKKFSKIERNHTYKDELVITYLLFLGKILNIKFLAHTFQIPQSQSIFHWIYLYKKIVYSTIVLLYNKKFTDDDWIHLDDMVYNLNQGHYKSVRHYLEQMKILTIPKDYTIDMEEIYDEILTVSAEDFGPCYWQMIHWMAEAILLRKNADYAKNIWKEFTIHLLDRTLMCSICIHHYKTLIIEKHKNELANFTDYVNLWFNIHNQVNKLLNKLEYPKSEFEKDQQIIRELLSPPKK